MNVRKFSQSLRGLADLVTAGVLSTEAAEYLADAVASGQSVLVSGATQAGKTTMLMALLDAIADSERIVTLSSIWSPPVVSEFFPSSLRMRVGARAQTFLR